MLVRDTDAWAHLTFIIKTLNDIATDAQIEGPVLGWAPLVLHPELFSCLDVLVGRFPTDRRSLRRSGAGVERKNLGGVVGSAVIKLDA